MLMGDLLITNSGVPSTIRKKVTILTKNFAVGWTGSLPTARAVIGKLRQTLPSEGIVDKKWLEDALTAYAADDFGHLGINLVGWLIADEDYCFRWRSDYPIEVFYGDPMVDGSGAPACRRDFGEDGAGSHTSSKRNERDDLNRIELNEYHIPESLHLSLNIATRLMSDEILSTGFYRSFSIGHAYEIIYLGNNGFQYLDNLFYFVLTLHFDENGGCISQVVESPCYKYHTEQEHAILEKYSHTQSHVHVDIIEPLDFANPEFVKQLLSDIKAKLRCELFLYVREYACSRIQRTYTGIRVSRRYARRCSNSSNAHK